MTEPRPLPPAGASGPAPAAETPPGPASASPASGAFAAVVELSRLTKRYDGRAVVDGVTLSLTRGEILALLGPNGAGKTTTVEMIEGYRRPDGGAVRVFGLDPFADAQRIKARVGLMLQSGGLYSQLRPIEALELFAAFYRDPLDPGSLLDRVGLRHVARSRYRALSGGERQRLSLALAIVGRPELAILDEPTAAMDAAARRSTWALLREMRDAGTTILLTTHFLEEAEELADRVAILNAGRLVALGSPADLRRGAATSSGGLRQVRLDLTAPLDAPHVEGLARLPTVASVRDDRDGRYAIATASPGELLVELSSWLWAARIEPLAIHVAESSLEEAFLRITADAAGSGSPEPDADMPAPEAVAADPGAMPVEVRR